MKVYIGDYKRWVGPYQLAYILQHFGLSKDRCHKIGGWLADTPLRAFCEWIYKKRKRTVKIRIDNYDIWNLDHTLALIIAPALCKMKGKCGVPMVDEEDVPEELHCPKDELDKNGWIPIKYSSPMWNYVMDEMIWTFTYLAEDHDLSLEEEQKADERAEEGLRLFGKYFRVLWT